MIRGEEIKKRKYQDVCVVPVRLRLSFLVAVGVMVLHMSRMNLSIVFAPMIKITIGSNSTFFGNIEEGPPYCSHGELTAMNFTTEQQSLPKSIELFISVSTHFTSDTEITSNTNRSQISLTAAESAAVLGSFYCGYIISPIVGGRLADLYGTKLVLGSAIFVDTVVMLVTPIAVKSHYAVLIILILVMGLFQGTSQPSLHSLMARWIPPAERPRFMTFSYLAYCISLPLTSPYHASIINHLEWESVFYISGCISLMWLLIWTCLMRDNPTDHPRMSDREKRFISRTTQDSGTSYEKVKSSPWRQMATSSSLLAISLAHVGNMLGFSMLIYQFPIYFKSAFGLPLEKSGVWFFLPAIGIYLSCNMWAWIDSLIAKRRCMSKAFLRKLLVSTGFLCPAILFVTIGYVGCNIYLALSLCAAGIFLNGAAIVGYGDAHLHIAPNFAGTCFGFSETFAFGLATAGPLVADYFTYNGNFAEWQVVFWVMFLSYCFCALFFVLFASFDIQSWNAHGLESIHREEEMITKLTSDRNAEAYS